MFFIAAAGRYLAGTGKIWVWLFFVLSALLLTRNFVNTGFGMDRLISYGVGRVFASCPYSLLRCWSKRRSARLALPHGPTS